MAGVAGYNMAGVAGIYLPIPLVEELYSIYISLYNIRLSYLYTFGRGIINIIIYIYIFIIIIYNIRLSYPPLPLVEVLYISYLYTYGRSRYLISYILTYIWPGYIIIYIFLYYKYIV